RTARLPSYEVDTGGDVFPLVAAPNLGGGSTVLEEAQEIVRLGDFLTKICVRQAGIGTSPPRAPGLPRGHGADREFLSDLAEECKDVETAEPGVVVEKLGSRRRRAELDEARDLRLEPFGRRRDLCLLGQRPLSCFAARITNQPGSATD